MSQVWRGITWGAELRQDLRWKVNNGRKVFFRQDIWLESTLLLESLDGELDGSLMDKKVADYWEQGLGLKRHELHQQIPATQLLKLASTVLRPEKEQMDRMGWLEANEGKFEICVPTGLPMAGGESLEWVETDREDEDASESEGVHLAHDTWEAPYELRKMEEEAV